MRNIVQQMKSEVQEKVQETDQQILNSDIDLEESARIYADLTDLKKEIEAAMKPIKSALENNMSPGDRIGRVQMKKGSKRRNTSDPDLINLLDARGYGNLIEKSIRAQALTAIAEEDQEIQAAIKITEGSPSIKVD